MVRMPPGTFLIPFRGIALKGQFYSREVNGKLYFARWPRKQKTARTSAEADNRRLIAQAASVTKYMSAAEQQFSRELAAATKLSARDLLMISLFNRIGTVILRDGRKIFTMAAIQDVSKILDSLGQTPGDILIRGEDFWTVIPIGEPNTFLGIDEDGIPGWYEVGGGGGGGGLGVRLSKQSGNQTVPSFTHFVIDFDTIDYMDPAFSVDLSANTITILEPGYYLVNVYTRYTSGVNISDIITLDVNGTLLARQAQENRQNAVSSQMITALPLGIGDVLTAYMDTNAGATFTNTASVPGAMTFTVQKI